MMRLIVNGDTLSRHRNPDSTTDEYPELFVFTGEGPGGGALICSIQGFHWCRVKVRGGTTTLWFEDRTRLEVTSGIVKYYDPSVEEATEE
jgi:hypothetical protein